MLSRGHALVRRLRALRRDRGLRDAEGVLVAEGLHLAREALLSGAPIELAVASPRLLETDEGRGLRQRLEEARIEVYDCPDSLLASLQDARSPQAILVVVRRKVLSLDALLAESPDRALLVVTYGIQDPGNLGSIWRTADAAGATGLVATVGSADLHHPRTVRGTMGSIFRLPAATSTFDELQSSLPARGIARVGAALHGREDYDRFDWSRATALFLGAEGRGLPDAILDRMDWTVRIPLREGVESLSVGAAAAVLLFEAARQRGEGVKS